MEIDEIGAGKPLKHGRKPGWFPPIDRAATPPGLLSFRYKVLLF